MSKPTPDGNPYSEINRNETARGKAEKEEAKRNPLSGLLGMSLVEPKDARAEELEKKRIEHRKMADKEISKFFAKNELIGKIKALASLAVGADFGDNMPRGAKLKDTQKENQRVLAIIIDDVYRTMLKGTLAFNSPDKKGIIVPYYLEDPEKTPAGILMLKPTTGGVRTIDPIDTNIFIGDIPKVIKPRQEKSEAENASTPPESRPPVDVDQVQGDEDAEKGWSLEEAESGEEKNREIEEIKTREFHEVIEIGRELGGKYNNAVGKIDLEEFKGDVVPYFNSITDKIPEIGSAHPKLLEMAIDPNTKESDFNNSPLLQKLKNMAQEKTPTKQSVGANMYMDGIGFVFENIQQAKKQTPNNEE